MGKYFVCQVSQLMAEVTGEGDQEYIPNKNADFIISKYCKLIKKVR
jgi:hypothetical protein